MCKALEGVRILDFTHVQSGPTCTQLLAWFGADVIKVERPGTGDITRGQLRDIPNVDSLYFTMLNHNKRSITLDTKNTKGKEVLEALVKTCDVLVENFAPGVLDRMGLTWERIQELNPRMIVASIKGFGPGPLRGLQGLRERRAMRRRRRLDDRLPRRPAARHRRADRRFRHRPASRARHRGGAVPAHHDGPRPEGRPAPCRTACSTCAASSCATSSASPTGRSRNTASSARASRSARRCRAPATTSGGGQPGRILKCKGWETDPNAYIYFITQAPGLGGDLRRHRRAGMEDASRLRQAAGPPAAAQRDLRPHRSNGP